MCEYLGYEVTQLKRIRIMNVSLDIPVGSWRYLTENELQLINSNTQDSSKTEEASIFNTKNPERSSKKTQSSRNNSSNSLGKKSGSSKRNRRKN